MPDSATIQQSAYWSILWACASSWYFGFHLSELNYPVASLTCYVPGMSTFRLPLCLGLDQHRYGLVTAIYTIGGLIGSLSSSWLVQKEGVKGGITWSGYLNLIGALGMSMAPHWMILALGRFIVGLSSGFAICLVPPFLNFISRASPQLVDRSGQIGTLHQFGIVIGLFSAQLSGMIFTGKQGDIPGNWRYVTMLSGIVAAIQVLTASSIYTPTPESVSKAPRRDVEAERTVDDDGMLSPVPEADEASPLVTPGDSPTQAEPQMSLRGLLSNTSFRGPALLCASILGLQQLSGVNAVMFYSTPVLKPILPSSAGFIGIQITFVNALMTIVAIFLVDRMGRRPLLLASSAMMAICSAVLAYGLDSSRNVLSAAAIILFIVGFSFGLGPIPFLLVSEMVPAPGIPALASLSLSLNWVSNFFIAMFFLPLRDALSSPVDRNDPLSDRIGEGRIFYVFTGVCSLIFIIVWRGLGGARSNTAS